MMSNGVETADQTPSSEIATILAESQKAHDELARLHSALEERILALDSRAFARGRKQGKPSIYKPLETAERKQLRASQSELSDSIVVLATVTAARLSDSNEVAGLRDKIQTVSAGLQNRLTDLQKMQTFAQTAGAAAAAVEKSVANITNYAAKLA